MTLIQSSTGRTCIMGVRMIVECKSVARTHREEAPNCAILDRVIDLRPWLFSTMYTILSVYLFLADSDMFSNIDRTYARIRSLQLG